MLGLAWWAVLWVETVLYCDQPSNDVGPFLKPPDELRWLAPYVDTIERGFYRSPDGQTNWPELRYHVGLDRDRLAHLLMAQLTAESGWMIYQGSSWHQFSLLGGSKNGADGRPTLILWSMTETWGWTDLFVRDYSVSYTPAQIRLWRELHGPIPEPRRLRIRL